MPSKVTLAQTDPNEDERQILYFPCESVILVEIGCNSSGGELEFNLSLL